MSRSTKKGPFVDTPLLEKITAMHAAGEKRVASGGDHGPLEPALGDAEDAGRVDENHLRARAIGQVGHGDALGLAHVDAPEERDMAGHARAVNWFPPPRSGNPRSPPAR